jgi:hypothetical protein
MVSSGNLIEPRKKLHSAFPPQLQAIFTLDKLRDSLLQGVTPHVRHKKAPNFATCQPRETIEPDPISAENIVMH